MAHDNDGLTDIENPMVVIPLEVPLGCARRWVQQPQYVISDRMFKVLDAILTPEQKAQLDEASVEFQPVIFPTLVLQ